MKKSFGTTVILISFSLFLASVGLSAPDHKGPASADLPEPAQKAHQGAAWRRYARRIEEFIKDDQAYYRVELTKQSKDQSFTVDDEGKLCRLQVSLEKAPDKVQAVIRQQLGDGKLVQIDKVSGEEGTTYEVEITKGGRDREFTVNANGELTRLEFFLEETPASGMDYVCFAAIVLSDLLFVLCVSQLVSVTLLGPFWQVWCLAMALFVAEVTLALSRTEGEDSLPNIMFVAVSFFTYCQLWLIVVFKAARDDYLLRKPRVWAKRALRHDFASPAMPPPES